MHWQRMEWSSACGVFFSLALESVCLWYHLINHSWNLPFHKYLERIFNYFFLYWLYFYYVIRAKSKQSHAVAHSFIGSWILRPRLISNAVLHLHKNHAVKYIPKFCICLHAFGFSRPAGKAFAKQLNSIEMYLSMCLIHLLKWSHGAWS